MDKNCLCDTTTASGIILTAPKEKANNQAKVIAVGPKCDSLLECRSIASHIICFICNFINKFSTHIFKFIIG